MNRKPLTAMTPFERALDAIRGHADSLSVYADFAINHPDATERQKWVAQVYESLDYMAALKADLIKAQAQEVRL